MALFLDRYRIESARLKNWDYSSTGLYFATICTTGKNDWFGRIKDGKMILSQMGEIVSGCWSEIPKHAKNIKLDEFVIMPDHVHGIIEIGNEYDNGTNNYYNGMGVAWTDVARTDVAGMDVAGMDVAGMDVAGMDVAGNCRDVACNVSTGERNIGMMERNVRPMDTIPGNTINDSTNNKLPNIIMSEISPKSTSLSANIRSFKSACTKQINRIFPNNDFQWQPRFHDHIIRNDESLQKIRFYIRNNPKRWKKDGKDDWWMQWSKV